MVEIYNHVSLVIAAFIHLLGISLPSRSEFLKYEKGENQRLELTQEEVGMLGVVTPERLYIITGT